MTTHDQLLLWHALYQLEARYWHEVDFNGGRNAHEFFTQSMAGITTILAIKFGRIATDR